MEFRIAGTLPVTAQSPREIRTLSPLADFLNLVEIVLRTDRALDQRDIHFLGKFLGIHQRPVDDVDLAGQRNDGRVHIEQRHVAAGAAIEPHA